MSTEEHRGAATDRGRIVTAAEEHSAQMTPPEPPDAAGGQRPPEEAGSRRGSAGLAALVGSGGAIAWLALLLVLLLAATGMWRVTEGQRREAELLQRVQALESVSGQDTTTFDQLRSNLERQIELEVEAITAKQQRFEEDQSRAQQRLEAVAADAAQKTGREIGAEVESLRSRLGELESALRQQSQRIAQLGIEDRDSWLLAEAQYLLRLANQRLIMTGDTLSAEALMSSADNILREIGDVDLHKVRGALAADLVAVRAVPKLDLEGLYLRVDGLIRQTDDLVMFEMPVREPPAELAEDADWKARLAYGYQAAVAKLSQYVVVSRRDTPVETLMDPQYEGLVRQNMRMLLEQAQVALLSGNQTLFERSLERAGGWVQQFFKDDQKAAEAMLRELEALAQEQVSVDLPDLNESLSAIDEAVRLRLERSGEQGSRTP